MKYQKPLAIVGGIVVAGIGLLFLRNFLKNAGGFNVRDVTKTKQADGLTTTPIKTAAVAAPPSTLQLLLGSARETVKSIVPSLNTRVPANAKLTPYGNTTSAAAALRSPTATPAANYRPSAWASIKPR